MSNIVSVQSGALAMSEQELMGVLPLRFRVPADCGEGAASTPPSVSPSFLRRAEGLLAGLPSFWNSFSIEDSICSIWVRQRAS